MKHTPNTFNGRSPYCDICGKARNQYANHDLCAQKRKVFAEPLPVTHKRKTLDPSSVEFFSRIK